jgi:uncharacterized protein
MLILMKRINSLSLLLSFILSAYTLSAQKSFDKSILPGSWMGKLSVNTVELRLVFNIKLTDKDSLVATMDSPDQGAKNIPLGRVIHKADQLTIQAPLMLGEFKGTITSDTTINGTWTQRGAAYAINLKKLKKAFALNRPQEPKPPYPYSSEDVTFTNSKFKIALAGTLTIPEGKGPFPAAILITGSGGQNRDEELLGHKPFLVISDWLTRRGIAVLRFDDRGVGKSQGSQLNSTSADFASDVETAFDFVVKNPKINPRAIGLIGHSEGGLIAPIVASSNHNIAFIVSLAGMGVTGQQISIRQTETIARNAGMNEDQIKETTELNKRLYAVLRKEKDDKRAELKIIAIYREYLEKKKASKDEIDKAVNQLKAEFGAATYAWSRYYFFTDPSVYWGKVKCPVLALNGEKDIQIAADENLPEIERAVKSSGNKSVKTEKLPGLNHLFQHSKKGLTSEYGEIEETFSPEVLKIISDWILDLKVSR